MTPELVARAIELGLIGPGDADRFLRDTPPPRPMHIVPKVPPPPERLKLVSYNGRIRRARAAMTRALLHAGVVDPNVVKARPPDHRQEDTA